MQLRLERSAAAEVDKIYPWYSSTRKRPSLSAPHGGSLDGTSRLIVRCQDKPAPCLIYGNGHKCTPMNRLILTLDHAGSRELLHVLSQSRHVWGGESRLRARRSCSRLLLIRSGSYIPRETMLLPVLHCFTHSATQHRTASSASTNNITDAWEIHPP